MARVGLHGHHKTFQLLPSPVTTCQHAVRLPPRPARPTQAGGAPGASGPTPPPAPPPPPPTVAPPIPKPARQLLRSSYRRPRKSDEDYAAARAAAAAAAADAGRGVTRWLDGDAMAALSDSDWEEEEANSVRGGGAPKRLIIIDGGRAGGKSGVATLDRVTSSGSWTHGAIAAAGHAACPALPPLNGPSPSARHPRTPAGYNFLNASPRYSATTKAGRLQAARDALHSDLEALTAASSLSAPPAAPAAGASGSAALPASVAAAGTARTGAAAAGAAAPRTSVMVVYDAMHHGGAGAGGAFDREFDRRVSAAMDAVVARFPPHSAPAAHRLRAMALAELGLEEGAPGGGRPAAAGAGVSAVFSRDCEADTWILDEVDSLAARWCAAASVGAFGPASGAGGHRRGGRELPSDVVVVSDDNRIKEGVFFAAMGLIRQEEEEEKERQAADADGGARATRVGGEGAGLSLSVWSCAALDGALDAAARRRGAGAAAAAASAAWAAAALGGRGVGAGGGSSAESDSEGGWPDGDYDEIGGEEPPAAVGPLTPSDVSALLEETGDALSAAGASLEALLAMDLGSPGTLPPPPPR
jgi:hypothetical protein